MNEPALAATADVMATSFQTPVTLPGVNVVIVEPLAGLLL